MVLTASVIAALSTAALVGNLIGGVAEGMEGGEKIWNKVKGIIDKKVENGEDLGTEDYSIEWMQRSLAELTGVDLEIDGEYGEATKAAAMAFQEANPPLEVDGWVGDETKRVMIAKLIEKHSKPPKGYTDMPAGEPDV